MRKFLILLFLPVSALAADFPADFALSWTNASLYVDGTSIDNADLTGVRIVCIRVNDGSPLLNGTFVPTGVGLAQTETFVAALTRAGEYRCTGVSIVSDGTESDPSTPVTFKVIGKPNPPNGMSVN